MTWAAEIRDPIHGARLWPGTYTSAIREKKSALSSLKEPKKATHEENTSLTSSIEKTELSHPSPLSVLDVPDPLNKNTTKDEIVKKKEVSEVREPSFAELFETHNLQIPSSDYDYMNINLCLDLDLRSIPFKEGGELEFDFKLEDVPFLSDETNLGDDFPSLDSIKWEDFHL